MYFLSVIFDLHMKYPVINKKQFIPIFPQAEKINKNIELKEKLDVDVNSYKPEFIT